MTNGVALERDRWIEILQSMTALKALTMVIVDETEEYQSNAVNNYYFKNLAKVLPALRQITNLSLWHMNHLDGPMSDGYMTVIEDEDIVEIAWSLKTWPLPLLKDLGMPEGWTPARAAEAKRKEEEARARYGLQGNRHMRGIRLNAFWRNLELPAEARG
jgi:hypothetical protein